MAVVKNGGTFLAVLQCGGTFSVVPDNTFSAVVMQYGGTLSTVPGTSFFGGTDFNRGFSKLRMELFLRMNNTRNCSRGLPKYFASEMFWWFWGATLRFEEREAVCTYAYEYFALKKLLPLASTSQIFVSRFYQLFRKLRDYQLLGVR